MNKVDVVIIGSGIFGSTISRYLEKKGVEHVVIDANHEYSGSKCSAGVWKDSWINDKIKERVLSGISLVDKMYGIETLEFHNKKENLKEEIYYVDVKKILLPKKTVIKDSVLKIENDTVTLTSGEVYKANKAVILAAGAFVDKILVNSGYLPMGVDKYWGNCFFIKSEELEENFIDVCATYRQLVCFQKTDGDFYFSNGSTVKNPKSNDDPRIEKNTDRLFLQSTKIGIKTSQIVGMKEGFRPYLKDKGQDFVQKVDEKLIVTTGGAKNSTILSGYIAKKVFKTIEL